MGLVEKLKKDGISSTNLGIAVKEKTHEMLEFNLTARLDENGGRYEKFIYGPVVINEDPGVPNPIYLNMLNDLSEDAGRVKVSESDAKKIITAAQQKIITYESEGVGISNRNDFFLDE
jgi:hypothetical protein